MRPSNLFLILGLIFFFWQSGRAADYEEKIFSHEFKTANGGRVWIYLPPHSVPGAKLPCVLVPPAGSQLFYGMSMAEDDRVEHFPYARAGFVVVSFDISGPLPKENDLSTRKKAVGDFLQARLGTDDALNALQLALEQYPQIDPDRVYIAGHSSAATLSLQVAGSTDKVKACVAFAPVTDLDAWFSRDHADLENLAPGMVKSLHDLSPLTLIDSIHCPVFLFCALDDDGVPPGYASAYKDALVARQKSAELVVVAKGGHYDSMIKEGIPRAIQWLKALDQKN